MSDSVHTARYKKLCELLIEARRANNLSQEALAAKLGRVQTFISKYERGERRLDVVEFLEVAVALGMDVSKTLRTIQAEGGR